MEAAIASFARHGFEGTTTAAVARSAGVTQPLVHRHFQSKQGLWEAAMERVFDGAQFFENTLTDASPLQTVQHALRRFVITCAENTVMHQIVVREANVDSERLAHLVENYLGTQYADAVANLRAAQSAGLMAKRISPELLVFLAVGAGSHLFSIGALAERAFGVDVRAPETREAFADLVVDVITRGVLVEDASPPPAARKGRSRKSS